MAHNGLDKPSQIHLTDGHVKKDVITSKELKKNSANDKETVSKQHCTNSELRRSFRLCAA